jgi:hypothetical protein
MRQTRHAVRCGSTMVLEDQSSSPASRNSLRGTYNRLTERESGPSDGYGSYARALGNDRTGIAGGLDSAGGRYEGFARAVAEDYTGDGRDAGHTHNGREGASGRRGVRV